LLLALALALPLLWPPASRAAAAGAAALTATALLAAAVALIRAGGDVSTLVGGRLTEPLGYPNAMAALLLAGALPPLCAAVHARCGGGGWGLRCGGPRRRGWRRASGGVGGPPPEPAPGARRTPGCRSRRPRARASGRPSPPPARPPGASRALVGSPTGRAGGA